MSFHERFLEYLRTHADLILLGDYVNSSSGISVEYGICGNKFDQNVARFMS